MTALLTGVVLGFAASGHCAAMCGPLVLVSGRSLRQASRPEQLRHALLYHGGRIATYLLLAVVAGSVGAELASSAAGRVAAVAGAIVLLDRALGFTHGRMPPPVSARYRAVLGRAAQTATAWTQGRRIAGPLAAGAVHGFVPCGMIYAALAAATAAGSTVGALEIMAGFGLGTTPVLAGISGSPAAVPGRMRTALRRLTPAALALAAALLLMRAFASHGAGYRGERTHTAAVHGPVHG